ncbi:DUF3488 and transglutaminase-like domain-containing protein [Knoellia sp. p5-6-4]|uniref:transglutaminase family protein n=1 Tax=unclassified Knoellia TaxID=2618719 RepID=UPI0023DAB3DC|nr:DUF3488 and transglutaminase-like domain-containing protein [Knoellia sp. p5-6-4]MDF2145125.1 DUF3488 and transglutaminase-like domain-containing protein [Knoellia sp. p5-6-4]
MTANPLQAPRASMLPQERTRADRVAEHRAALLPTRDDLVDVAFTVLLVGLGLIGFRTVFFGWEWVVAAIGGVMLGLLVTHVVTAYRLPAVVTLVGLAVAYFVFGGPLALREHLALGVFPTGRTLRDLASTAVHGWKRLLTLLPPVDSTVDLLAVPLLVGLVGAAVTYGVARRSSRPYAGALAPLAVLGLVILLGTLEPASLIAQGAVFALGLIGWLVVQSTRTRAPLHNGAGRGARVGIGTGLLVLAGVVGLVAGPALPGTESELRRVARTEVVPPFDIAQFASPLAGYRKYTEPNEAALWDRPLLTVKGAPAGTPLRFATLDAYDGTVWGAGERASENSADPGTAFQQVGSRVAARGGGKPATVQVTVPEGGYTDVWLPTIGQVTGVQFGGTRRELLSSRLWLNIDTSTAIVPDRLRAGDRYAMQVLLPTQVAADKLPDNLTPASGDLVQNQELGFLDTRIDGWTGNADGPWAQFRAIAAAMRSDGAYTDGGAKNSVESYYLAGHSRGRLTRFVGATQLAGNDEQYAATLALAANRLSIPTRVVMGAELPEGGVVRGRDVHAWVEVQNQTGQWIPLLSKTFLPDRNQKPNQLQSKTDQQKVGAQVPPPAGVNPPSVLQGPDQAQNAVNLKKPPKKLFDPASWPWWMRVLVLYVLLPLLGLVGLYWGIRGAKEWRRNRHATHGPAVKRIAWAWDDLMNTAQTYGHKVPRRATRIEQASSLQRVPVSHELAVAANAHIFGPGEPDIDHARAYWAQTRQARADLRAQCDFWHRLRADVDPRPLFARGPHRDTSPRRSRPPIPLT